MGGKALALGSISGVVLGPRRLVFGVAGSGIGAASRTSGRAIGKSGGGVGAVTTGRANTTLSAPVDVATFERATAAPEVSVTGDAPEAFGDGGASLFDAMNGRAKTPPPVSGLALLLCFRR
jgi:hypothetical protein